jgi:hypothetical protein
VNAKGVVFDIITNDKSLSGHEPADEKNTKKAPMPQGSVEHDFTSMVAVSPYRYLRRAHCH